MKFEGVGLEENRVTINIIYLHFYGLQVSRDAQQGEPIEIEIPKPIINNEKYSKPIVKWKLTPDQQRVFIFFLFSFSSQHLTFRMKKQHIQVSERHEITIEKKAKLGIIIGKAKNRVHLIKASPAIQINFDQQNSEKLQSPKPNKIENYRPRLFWIETQPVCPLSNKFLKTIQENSKKFFKKIKIEFFQNNQEFIHYLEGLDFENSLKLTHALEGGFIRLFYPVTNPSNFFFDFSFFNFIKSNNSWRKILIFLYSADSDFFKSLPSPNDFYLFWKSSNFNVALDFISMEFNSGIFLNLHFFLPLVMTYFPLSLQK